MNGRWRAAVTDLAAAYPALLHALPARLIEVQHGAAVGLSSAGVVARRDWLASAVSAEVQAAILHLAAHAALGHRPWRVPRAAASVALDAAAEQLLRDCGVPEAVTQWRGDHHGHWRGVPDSEPGEAMMARPEGNPRAASSAEPIDASAKAPNETPEEASGDAPNAGDAAATAASGERSGVAGQGRGGGRAGQALTAPARPMDWRALLTVWLTRRTYQRWQFDRPSRRVAPPLLLPRLGGRRVSLVLAVDVSGSIDPAWMDQFLAEAERLRAQLPLALRLITCDNRIHEDRPVQSLATVDARAGGGGTDFRPVFDALAHDAAVDALVYCTDLSGTLPTRAPAFPVFWLVPWQSLSGQAVSGQAVSGQAVALSFGTVLWMNVA